MRKLFLFGSVLISLSFLSGFAVRGMFQIEALPTVAADCQDEPCASPPCCNGDVNGDGAIDISDAVSLLTYLFSDGSQPLALEQQGQSCSLPSTGQTKCYAKEGDVVDCDNEDVPGQDGFYQAGYSMEDRFVDNGDGTVTDNCTGLMWQQATILGECKWNDALKYCETLEFAGYKDWRLPNVRELQSIVNYGRADPATNSIFSTPKKTYWSSTTSTGEARCAWWISFLDGTVGDSGWYNKDNLCAVRAVRAGL